MTLFGIPISAAISAVVVSKPDRAKHRTAALRIERTRGFDQSTARESKLSRTAMDSPLGSVPGRAPCSVSSFMVDSFSDIRASSRLVAPPAYASSMGHCVRLEPPTEQDRCPVVQLLEN